jgi:DHA2 family multidrug resistance protein
MKSDGVNPWLIAFAVSLATFMEVLDTTIVNVSLSHIGGSLGATPEESTWTLTSYLVANGIILPLSGWIAGVIGRKKYFMLCIAFFTLASFFCGAATSLAMIIFFRILQGFAGGGLQPMQQAIMLDTFPLQKRAQAYAVTGITMIVAPILGPTLGGYITDTFGWRWIFFINVPVGLFALFMVSRVLHEKDAVPPRGAFSIDYFGMGLVAVGLGALQIMLDKGQQEDWFESNFIRAMLVTGVSCLSFACWWLLRQKNPLIELRLMKIPSFAISCLLIFFTGFTLYSSSILLPLLVQSQFGYDAMLSGMILSPGAVAIAFLMPMIARLSHKFPPKYLISIGFALCSAGMFYTSNFSPEASMRVFIAMRIVQVLGLPFLFIPISTIAFMDVPRQLNNKASALYSLFRNLGGSFGVALVATYLYRQSQIWQNNLSAHTSAYGVQMQQALAGQMRALQSAGVPALDSAMQAQGILYHQLMRQASLLAYVDSFQLMWMIMMALAPLALLLPSRNPSKAAVVPPVA